MNKKIIISIWIIFALIITLSFGYYFYNSNSKNKVIKDELSKLNSQNEIENNSENSNDKISILRKRFFVKWLIEKWDNYMNSNTPYLALNEYFKAYTKNPTDSQIIKKIALVYFELKNYKKTLEYFDKIKNDISWDDLEKYVLANIYTLNTKDKRTFDNALKNITESSVLNDEEKFYYTNSINCIISFHTCKKTFQEYISNNPELKTQKIKNIKSAIDNYNNFQSWNTYYKDSLIIAELFKDRLYTITNYLWASLLKSKIDYKPFILMVWKWAYEIWDLKKSKEYLEKYYKLEPLDPKVSFLLWNIAYRSKDYLTSNMYYTASLSNWFENKVDIKRKIIYNYYVLWDKKTMFYMFDSLLEEKDSNIDDYSLAIYRNILDWNTQKWILLSDKWLQKFNNIEWFEIFYWYLGWIYREKNDLISANNYLETWIKINSKNPLITLNMWYLATLNNDYNKALIYLKRTQNMNPDWEFWNLAKAQEKEIEKFMNSTTKNN